MSLTYGLHEHFEKAKGKQRLWQFAEKHLQCASDDMNVLPLAVAQIQLLLWRGEKEPNRRRRQGTITTSVFLMSKLENANHDVSVPLFRQWERNLLICPLRTQRHCSPCRSHVLKISFEYHGVQNRMEKLSLCQKDTVENRKDWIVLTGPIK